MQLDPLGMIMDPGTHSLGPVDRVLVHHQVHLGAEVLGQPVQEADEHPGGEGPLEHGEVQLAGGTDRAHGVDTEPVTAPGGGRCAPLQPPGAARQVIRTHPDLIGEHHPLPLDASPLTQVRPGLIDPLLLGPGVGFARAPVRALKGQPQAAQDLAYAPVGEGGAEQLLDQSGDLDGGPQGAAQPQLVGLVDQEGLGQSLFLGGGELGVLTGFSARPARAQSLDTVCFLAAAPVANRVGADTEDADGLGRAHTVVDRAHHPHPQCFLLGGCELAHVHTQVIVIAHVPVTPQEPTDSGSIASFSAPSKRFGALHAKGQFPKQKEHDTATSVAALVLTDVMHEFLLSGMTDSGQYAVRSELESWKRGTYLGLFLNERPGRQHRTIAALGLVSPIGKSGTFERKVEVSHFTALALPIPVEHFSSLGKLVRDAFDRNRGIPPATGRKILNELAKISNEAAKRIRSLEAQLSLEEPDITDRPVRALEKDAVGVLFEAFDIDREHLLSWRKTGDGDPFLSGLDGALKGGRYNPQEKWLVDFDATHLPGWSFHRSDYVAWGVFTNKYKSRSLLVANIDRTPAEHATGVDLVYYNPHGGNFVMLQYKVLEETVQGGLYKI